MSRRAVAPPLEGPLLEHVADRVAAIRRQQLADLQLKLFPDWPDDRRGAPNAVIRSAIFGVVRKGRRRRVVKMPVAGPAGYDITVTGWRLDQYDCDVWLEVHHLARNSKPGESVRFSQYSMLRRLGRSPEGKTNFAWLRQRLEGLMETTIVSESATEVCGVGNLILGFRIDKTTGEAVVRTNPELRALWESITHLDVEQRRLCGSQLAKALHAVLASHVEWVPMRISTLMQRLGADYERLRDFKRDLRAVLDDFQARGWLRSYSFEPGAAGELLAIDKVRTPTQVRSLERQGTGITLAP